MIRLAPTTGASHNSRKFRTGAKHDVMNMTLERERLKLISFATKCDGVKCLSCDLNACMSVSCSNGAKRCGGGRCEAMRSGAANTKRSDDDEEKRGNLHWQAPTRSKSVYHSTNVSLSSTILRRNALGLHFPLGPCAPCRSPDVSPAV